MYKEDDWNIPTWFLMFLLHSYSILGLPYFEVPIFVPSCTEDAVPRPKQAGFKGASKISVDLQPLSHAARGAEPLPWHFSRDPLFPSKALPVCLGKS